MGRSWELTENQKKEIQEQQAEIGAQYDPETVRKKDATENAGDNENVEASHDGREKNDDDDNIRE